MSNSETDPSYKHKLVLIVDDEEKIRTLLKQHIESRIGCQTITATSGEEAVELVELKHPDLVLLDIKMSGIGGLVALKCMKAIAPNTPVVMVSVVWDAERTEYCFQAGAYDFITKPVDFERLDKVLATHLGA